MQEIVFFLAMSVASNALGDTFSGNDGQRWCSSSPATIEAYTAGWIDKRDHDLGSAARAALDSFDTPAEDITGKVAHDVADGFCLPSGDVTLSQVMAIGCKYLANTPEKRHLPLGRILASSLAEAFPRK